MAAAEGFWLVKTGSGAAEVQQFPAGQKPLAANWGGAVYLGSTTQEAAANTPRAARQLRVPNPQNVPSLSLSTGIIGSELFGFGLGALGQGAAAGGEAALAGTAADTTSAADAAAAGTGGSSLAAKAGIAGVLAAAITSPLDFLKFIAWIFHPRNILRMVEFLTGIALMAFGAHAALQGRGERIEGFTTSEGALTRSGLGRVARELGASARREGGGESGRRVRRPQSAPHTTRRTALRQRYQREQSLSRRKTAERRKRNSSNT